MRKPPMSPRYELQLPDFAQSAPLLRVVVFSQILALLLTLASDTEQAFWLRLGLISLLVQWISLVSILVFSRLRPFLKHASVFQLAIAVLLLLALITFISSAAAYNVLASQSVTLNFIHFVLNNVLIAVLVGLVLIQFLIMYDELARTINGQHQAKFSALQARIRPHFLFNSLNTVAELIHTDPLAAEQALLNLADLFRAAMAHAERISLQEELALCHQYLALEQWRLGNRLQVNWQVTDTIPVIMLPALTIQPLIENAIQYGFEKRLTTGVLDVTAYLGKKQLSIVIENPIAESHDKHVKNGIALSNIRQRLQLCFGQHAQLTTYQLADIYRVKLVLPLGGS